jgi:hypothetical protein
MTTERGASRLGGRRFPAPGPGVAERAARAERSSYLNRNGGLGIVGVIVVVLVILWLVGVIKL